MISQNFIEASVLIQQMAKQDAVADYNVFVSLYGGTFV